jgi:hypothetical protein
MSSVNVIIWGMLFLAVSLVAYHFEQTELDIVVKWAGGWIGSIMVIVGTGKLLFVDD